MASYTRIGLPAWTSVLDERGKVRPRFRDEDFEYLDYQVRCWQESLPVELRPEEIPKHIPTTATALQTSMDRGTQFLRFILYLRANQFKIVILRPLLFSARTVRASIKRIQNLAHVANDSIETIMRMNATYDLYRKQQPILNVFLSSALSTLFLVYIHTLKGSGSDTTTSELSYGSTTAREGIDKGLALIRSYSGFRSSQRLWKKFAGRRGLLSRLGFTEHDNVEPDTAGSMQPSSSPDLPPTLHGNNLSENYSTIPWDNAHFAAYPALEGLDFFNGTNFQSGPPSSDFSPLPYMNPFLIPSDVGFLYNDMW